MATISNTPRPGYVYDSTDGVWYPIGTGAHTHADYITSSSAINPTIVDAKGDIIAATAADTVSRLAVGANDTVLTADSSTATGLKWAAPAGGKVLQVINATTDTATSNSSSSYTDTTLTATITPSSATSKILVLVNQTGLLKNSSDTRVQLKLLRNTTDLIFLEIRGGETGNSNIHNFGGSGCNYLDSPATTSAITYKTQIRSAEQIAIVTCQHGSSTSTITLLEIGA